MSSSHIAFGILGENTIRKHLTDKKYTILAQNFIYHKKCGEVDIIAQKDNVLAFVEVKTRRNHFAPIESMVNKKKQANIIKTAEFFFIKNNLSTHDFVIRFDIAYVCNNDIQYYPNAFTKSF